MNNVLIVGTAKEQDYIDAVLCADPEDIKIFACKEDYNSELESALKQLNLKVNITEQDGNYGITEIISFTNFIGVDQVMLIEEANKQGMKITIIKPK